MNHNYIFSIVFFSVIILWTISTFLEYILPCKPKRALTLFLNFTGVILLFFFILYLWIKMQRPPLKTLAETRLWYAFLLSSIALLIDLWSPMKWLTKYAMGMSILFLLINYLKPATFDKTLAPALQSPWFIPHVVVYMLAYALLAATSLFSIHGLYLHYVRKKNITDILEKNDFILNNGLAFLIMGLLFGALWAKEAWGHYWTWDPKETWALVTFLSYLCYIHLRYGHKSKENIALWFLALNFLILLICWFGIKYLPSAAGSIHTYST